MLFDYVIKSVKKDESPFTQLGRKQPRGYRKRFFVQF